MSVNLPVSEIDFCQLVELIRKFREKSHDQIVKLDAAVVSKTIAGHTFDMRGYCVCGRVWRNIAHVDQSYVGQPGIAHTGDLNLREADEIMLERAAEIVRAETATKEIASGG